MQKIILAPLLLWCASLCVAAPLAPPVRAEVEALLSSLEKSGCEFGRNGTWHPGVEAKNHLLRKLEVLEGKDAVKTTEQFIELGASTSSSSGKPYLVRCAGASPLESRKWLTTRLAALRLAGGKGATGPK